MSLSDKILLPKFEGMAPKVKVQDLKKTIQDFTKELKEEFGDNYFDSVYTSNRYWVMNKKRMTDKKFQDILTMICENFKKKIDKLNQKHYGDKLIQSQEVDVKDLKEDNNSSLDPICECGHKKIAHTKARGCSACFIRGKECKKFKLKEKLR